MHKWDGWYDSLPAHTKESLKDAAIWRDKDLALFVSIALVLGFFLVFIVG